MWYTVTGLLIDDNNDKFVIKQKIIKSLNQHHPDSLSYQFEATINRFPPKHIHIRLKPRSSEKNSSFYLYATMCRASYFPHHFDTNITIWIRFCRRLFRLSKYLVFMCHWGNYQRWHQSEWHFSESKQSRRQLAVWALDWIINLSPDCCIATLVAKEQNMQEEQYPDQSLRDVRIFN